MEWIRRNPKSAVALSALAMLCVIVFVWGMSGGSDAPSATPTLGPPTSSTAPSNPLTALPSPTGSPSSVADAIAGFPAGGMGALGPGSAGEGFHNGLPAHRIVISAGSDGPLLGVGWRAPTADGARGGKDLSGAATFRHAATVYGKPDYAQIYTYDGPESSTVWCTITVDGRVTDHQVAKGPWGQVFCQG
jgi:hypothetical protein